MKALTYISFAPVIIGALNWGLVGFLGVDLVAAIFGEMSAVSRVIYALVGLSGIFSLISAFRHCTTSPCHNRDYC